MKKIALAAALLLSGSAAASAADLIVSAPATVDPVVSSGFYANLLGGIALPGTLDHYEFGAYNHDHDLDAGWAFSIAGGYEFGNGFALELDALHTARNENEEDYGLTTTSLMAGVRYTVDVSDSVALYAGVGLGGIWTDDAVWEDRTAGLGYQVKLGVEMAVADNLSLVGEYRFQNAFSALDGVDDTDFGNLAPTHLVMAGVKLGF